MFRTTLLRQGMAVAKVPKPATMARPMRFYSTSQKKSSGAPSFAAMLAVASMGFAAYSMLVKSREGQGKSNDNMCYYRAIDLISTYHLDCHLALPRRKQPAPVNEEKQDDKQQQEQQQPTEEAKRIPAFSPEEVTVVFVLGKSLFLECHLCLTLNWLIGGPGAGKGTQCENLKRDYGFVHLSGK